MKTDIKTWIIGAGAIAENYHIPALRQIPESSLTGIVDLNEDRLHQVGNKFEISHRLRSYEEIPLESCDWVIICVPPGFQSSIAAYFLENDVHVFVEKPGSINADEFNRLVQLGEEKELIFSVGVFRRFYPAAQYLREAVINKTYGELKRIHFEEGYFYGWNNESAYIFDRKLAGGGVLLDTGAHTVDRVLYCSGANGFSDLIYSDNQKGGVESECEISFTVKTTMQEKEVPVTGKLSRLRELNNSFRFEFESATLSCGSNVPNEISIERLGREGSCETLLPDPGSSARIDDYILLQFTSLMRSMTRNDVNLICGASLTLNFELFDACYQNRNPIRFDWDMLPIALLKS